MGALHEGHLSLVKHARDNNDLVVASIFVNPTQFGDGEDLDNYPRQLQRDTELLTDMGVDHLFVPNKEIMYGSNHVTYVHPKGFDEIPEGVSRPGHFSGVATVVAKLFNIIQPTNAYFGKKDAAQCVLIQRMVEDLNFDIGINIMPTIREDDGLAMSSRNAHLKPDERDAASILYKSLTAAQFLHEASFAGQLPLPAQVFIETVRESLESEPMVSQIHYISIDSKNTMQPLEEVGTDGALISIACQIGSVRLIDNIIL
eukprot:CAMPEP_0197834248 /NCGR_PEP_ID=MMETSP1437-20131217/21775_1 /TAXON_ID=49252 ORGANISM="Eucampia antarctica, Strain CCMP1452" /NCGR_SAMPLE_ID=MMETSP1437 /ASSEMBLY_ACC=CAM_ASM_001096 /LENGTH=257 /DNA_ID=CAMNT_0043438797 /DNA_START=206 /DNA_END=979 /DNA_ORIENTATION=+